MFPLSLWIWMCRMRNWPFLGGAMRCFNFTIAEKKEDLQCTKSSSLKSCSTTSTERDARRSGSEINSLVTSDTSADSSRRSRLQSFSQRTSNLRVFSVAELKNATKSFSRSVMIGEGGFGCVYRGAIRSSDDPNSKIEIAVKQLGRRGLQVSWCKHEVFCTVLFNLFHSLD